MFYQTSKAWEGIKEKKKFWLSPFALETSTPEKIHSFFLFNLSHALGYTNNIELIQIV